MINTKLMRDTLTHIEEHPEQWNQEVYYSPTGCMCFAGHATRIAMGGTLVLSRPTWFPNTDIKEYAMGHLGLTQSDLDRTGLFHGENTLADLEWAVAYYEKMEGALQAGDAPHQPVPPIQQNPPLPQPEPYHPTDEPTQDPRSTPPPHAPELDTPTRELQLVGV